MENQVKRQIRINITNSPPAWGTPSRRGGTKENLTHFFGHYRLFDLKYKNLGAYARLKESIRIFLTAPVMRAKKLGDFCEKAVEKKEKRPTFLSIRRTFL